MNATRWAFDNALADACRSKPRLAAAPGTLPQPQAALRSAGLLSAAAIQPGAADHGGTRAVLSAMLIAASGVANQFEPVHIAVHHAAVGSKVLQCHAARRETPFEVSADFLP
jgi:hypothetical protein